MSWMPSSYIVHYVTIFYVKDYTVSVLVLKYLKHHIVSSLVRDYKRQTFVYFETPNLIILRKRNASFRQHGIW